MATYRPVKKEFPKAPFCIEVLYKGKFQLLGDEKGILRFATAEERDARLEALRKGETSEQ